VVVDYEIFILKNVEKISGAKIRDLFFEDQPDLKS
jgi:hypothetical protein